MIKFKSKGRTKVLHLFLTLVWLLLLVPTVVWWRESLPWLVFMSWYANFVGQWSAYEAAKK